MSRTSSLRCSTPVASSPGEPSSGRSTRIPVWSSPSPSSRAEQIIPSDTWPYVRRAVISTPSESTAPGNATTTRSPSVKLCAPQTMPRGSASPTSTWHHRMVLPLECVSASNASTRPTTSGPLTSSPARSTVSTSRPTRIRRAATSRPLSPGARSTYSRSQDMGTRIRWPSRMRPRNARRPRQDRACPRCRA